MLAAVEKELEALRMGISLTPQEQFEVFGTDQVGGEWADEAEQRWGDTDAYRESQRRMAAYTKQDWLEVKSQSDAALRAFAGAMASGQPADGPVARQLAEGQRQFLNRWFYDCDHEMHRGLAEIHVSDERFTATFDSVAPGLARYVHDAIIANAASAQGE
jgi:hypothetical protein